MLSATKITSRRHQTPVSCFLKVPRRILRIRVPSAILQLKINERADHSRQQASVKLVQKYHLLACFSPRIAQVTSGVPGGVFSHQRFILRYWKTSQPQLMPSRSFSATNWKSSLRVKPTSTSFPRSPFALWTLSAKQLWERPYQLRAMRTAHT